MRRILLLMASVTLMAGLTGCHAVTGECDCVDLPPNVVAPPLAHPAPGLPISSQPAPMPGDQTTMLLPSATDSNSSPMQKIAK